MRGPTLLLALLVGGCYAPKIHDDDFKCGPNGLCPSGFTCQTDVQLCRQSPGGAGPDMIMPLDMSAADMPTIFTGAAGALDLTGSIGQLICDTNTGEIQLVDSNNSKTTKLAAGTGFSTARQSNGLAVAIWSFTSLKVPQGITVRSSSGGQHPLVFGATGAIEIAGTIDLSDFGAVGGRPGLAGTNPAAGILNAGGAAGLSASDGGGGAGYATAGQSGSGSGGGAGGQLYGDENLATLHVGAGGGGGGGGSAGAGGNGGGALALFAKSVTISGSVSVAGFPGAPAGGAAASGGGGGGSGGSILISGDTVVLAAGSALNARGGAGGQGTGATSGDGGAAGGGSGGAGSAGRIWIGSATPLSSDGGSLNSTPAPKVSTSPYGTFPR